MAKDPLTFILWLWTGWRPVYDCHHVNAAVRQLHDKVTIPHRVICVTDQPHGITECDTYPLWRMDVPGLKRGRPNCFLRLRLFDKEFAKRFGPWLCSIDLDFAATRELTGLFDPGINFKAFAAAAIKDKGGINGSMWALRPGTHQEVWDRFNPETVAKELYGPHTAGGRCPGGSDQAWMNKMIVRPRLWGSSEGVYSYRIHVQRRETPENARLVFFAGRVKPWHAAVRIGHPELYKAYMKYYDGPAPHQGPSINTRPAIALGKRTRPLIVRRAKRREQISERRNR